MKTLARLVALIALTAILLPNTRALDARNASIAGSVVSSADIADADIVRGLKEALGKGTTSAIKELGRGGGYLNNPRVKIPMPPPLRPIEKTLRFMGRQKQADEFVATMNHAAEKAVVEAASVFADSIKQMTFSDAKAILTGPDDSATQYFKRTSEKKLFERFLPIVQKVTESTGVTAQYKRLTETVPFGALNGRNQVDLDSYVTHKAMDGLFLLIADEEKKIRRDPLARTSDILRKVFGLRRRFD